MSRFIRIGSQMVNLACPSLQMFKINGDATKGFSIFALYHCHGVDLYNPKEIELCSDLSQCDLNVYISRIEVASQNLNNK